MLRNLGQRTPKEIDFICQKIKNEILQFEMTDPVLNPKYERISYTQCGNFRILREINRKIIGFHTVQDLAVFN